MGLYATAGARLPDVTTLVQMAGQVRPLGLGARANTREKQGELIRVLLARRRQVLEMQAQEEACLWAAEYEPIREDLERHLFFLDRQLGRLHELLLYMVQAVSPR